MVGPGGVEPPTSRLSGVRSNHLSYEPRSAISNQNSHAISNQNGLLIALSKVPTATS